MSRKLSHTEIEELYEFCYFQSIVYYDLQVELVDHLALSIENLWTENPDLSFDNALYEVSQQFGGHAGFVIIRLDKEKALRKKYRRLLWQFVSEYYKFPKIAVTIALAALFFTIFRLVENDEYVFYSFGIGYVFLMLVYAFFYAPLKLWPKIKKGHSFLLNEIARGRTALTVLPGNIGVFVSLFVDKTMHLTFAWSVVVSMLISFFIVLLYGDTFFIPKKIREHLVGQYPQFVKA